MVEVSPIVVPNGFVTYAILHLLLMVLDDRLMRTWRKVPHCDTPFPMRNSFTQGAGQILAADRTNSLTQKAETGT